MRLTHKTNDSFTRYLPNHKKTRGQINNKLGQLEDVIEDIIDYTDGKVNGQSTITITFKQSNTLLKLLEELEDESNND